jgi:hypothetical protein
MDRAQRNVRASIEGALRRAAVSAAAKTQCFRPMILPASCGADEPIIG